MDLLGEWDFLYGWWWKPFIAPLLGLLWALAIIAAGGAVYYLVAGRTTITRYRQLFYTEDEAGPEIPSSEEEIDALLAEHYLEVSEEEILEMEGILEAVIREDVHPDMAKEIERRGIPVRMMALPPARTVKEVGAVPLAVWIPKMNAVEIYGGPMKQHCGGDARAYRGYMGEMLLHEMAHALGLDEPKIKDFGV